MQHGVLTPPRKKTAKSAAFAQKGAATPHFFLSFPSSAWRGRSRKLNPESGGESWGEAELRANAFPSGAWERQNNPRPVAPCRHSGIFIPLAPSSGIAHWRWRNENIRNLRRQAVGSSHRSPAPLARGIPDIFIPRDCIHRGHSTSRPRGMKIPE